MADFIVAVTGGVASGKSEATAVFEALGVTVADADVAARAVVEPGQPALEEIAGHFGPGVLLPDGQLDRVAMRRLVFSEPAAKAKLESLLHPRIRTWLHTACAAARGPYVVTAIPLLAEGGGRLAYPWLSRIVLVDVPARVQHRRLMQRDGIDAGLAHRMVEAQASRAERLAIADDVIINDGSRDDLALAVRRLHARYLELAGRG